MRAVLAPVALLTVLASACDSPMDSDAGAADAGPARDASADAGPNRDAGPGTDAGTPDAGPPAELEPNTPLGDQAQELWVFMQSHLHTTGYHACANAPMDPGTGEESACYSSEGIEAFLQEALANDAGDMIITDHNNIEAWFDPSFAPLANLERTAFATPLRGTEWSSLDGHMTLLFPSEVATTNMEAITNGWIFGAGNEAPVSSFDDYRMTIDSVHAVGGIVMINHPELAIHAFPEDGLDADGVEVGIPPNPLDDRNGGSVSLHSSAEARRYWHRRLVSGDRLTGTAGADHHHGGGDIPGLESPTFGIAVNWIRVDPALPDSSVTEALDSPQATIDRRTAIVMDAIRRGHVMVVESPEAARVFIGVDTDGDGRFHDARAGDCVAPEQVAGETVRMRIRIDNPTSASTSSHYNFEVWDQSVSDAEAWFVEVDYDTGFPEDARYTVDPSDPFAIEMDVPYDPAALGFLRVVLVRDVPGPVNDTEVVTNPVYLGDWGAQCDSASPLY